MLSANEFFVGALADAPPLSLVLPRNKYEATMLIGSLRGAPAAVFLSGQFAFTAITCVNNHSWKGLIVPNVRVEVDPSSLYNGDHVGGGPGSIIRTDTRLLIRGRNEHSFGENVGVILHEGLTPCAEGYSAGFTDWRVVVGEGQDKRILWRPSFKADDSSSEGDR